jgi:precorrin-8X/cobalt-precorrin-8 methylmutase
MSEKPYIGWNMSGADVEQESFRRIEEEVGAHSFSAQEWRVVRRMIHACADFSIALDIAFAHEPIAAIHAAVRGGAPIYCDSNMIRSGVSVARLQGINPTYTRESTHCYIADPDVAAAAKKNGTTRALASLDKGRAILDGAIVLIGNAPLALAGICRMVEEEGIRPAVVLGMPVGFVHVVESKQMLQQLDIPQVVLQGRRGGSPLAVSALHGALESINGI